jgi:hypothetical protein
MRHLLAYCGAFESAMWREVYLPLVTRNAVSP